MENLKEEMKQEAIRRLEMLKVLPSVVEAFSDRNIVYYSETTGKSFKGILYYLSNHPKWLQQVKEFEERTGYLVYHATLTHLEYDNILDLLYVTNRIEEWESERNGLYCGYAETYAINLSDSWMSEFGSAWYEPCNGGINKLQ